MAKPAGTPISYALIVRRLEPDPRGLTERVVRALAAVDRVHGDGDLPPVPVSWAPLNLGVEATYELVRFGGGVEVPQRIVVSTSARRPGLAVLFEIGHLLYHQTLGERGRFASLDQSLLTEWRQAVTDSRAFAELERLRDARNGGPHRLHMEYLISDDELWERSYAQYIAAKSADDDLIAEVQELRRRRGPVYIPYLWEDDDFAPVASAIDRHFRRLAWID